MSPDDLFGLAGMAVLPAWALLIFGPRRWSLLTGFATLALPLLLSAVYALIVLRRFAEAGGGFGSLTEVRTLFADDWGLLAGWIHYLAFDLVAGGVAAARMDRAGLSRLVQGPILALVFLFGPLGYLMAMLASGALRSLRRSPVALGTTHSAEVRI